ncbi:MAG: crossover junction endodeoxyribonuclease RuvC [Verrucomicrobia bacterium]|nr:crossover junction endodeoxyribonuclease RuvC [Verrucomicrobiota bacterium]
MSSIRILGVDTSLRSTGVAVIEVTGQKMRALAYGNIHNKPRVLHSECLAAIHREIDALIEEFSPEEVAIEGAFFAKNAKTAMILGQARGAVLALSALRGLPVYEYSPRSVKLAVVGVGSAQKGQVGAMVTRLLGLADPPQEDAADALAIAICHTHQRGAPEALRSKAI